MTRNLLGNNWIGETDWWNLIYDSLHSAIPESRSVILLAYPYLWLIPIGDPQREHASWINLLVEPYLWLNVIDDPEGMTRNLLGKDKRKGFDWPILIYDSMWSPILKRTRVMDKSIGGILSMTHSDRWSRSLDLWSSWQKIRRIDLLVESYLWLITFGDPGVWTRHLTG